MSLGRRVTHLEGPLPGGRLSPWARTLAIAVATEQGLDPAAVLRETTRLLVRAHDAGVLGSAAATAAFLAPEAGRTAEALLAETQHVEVRW